MGTWTFGTCPRLRKRERTKKGEAEPLSGPGLPRCDSRREAPEGGYLPFGAWLVSMTKEPRRKSFRTLLISNRYWAAALPVS